MLDREIRAGRICIIINSKRESNNGKVVEVVRGIVSGEYVPELDANLDYPNRGGWLVTGEDLEQGFISIHKPVRSEYAFLYTEQLVPIDEFQEDLVEQKEEEFSV